MKQIPLPHGEFTLVDDDDFEWLSKHAWCTTVSGYAVRNTSRRLPGGKKLIYMHKEIMGFPKCEVDHKDSDKLNNQRENLRACSRQQNCSNQSLSVANTSGYKGVFLCKTTNRWRACVKVFGKKKHLGRFDTPLEAALAYNIGAIHYFGDFAKPNKLP